MVKRVTFGLFDPIDFFHNRLNSNTNPDSIQDLIQAFFQNNKNADDVYKHIQNHNPITEGVHGKCLNTATTLFSSIHLALNAYTISKGFQNGNNDVQQNKISKLFSNSSVRRGVDAIKKLGEGKDKDDVKRDIYERLETLSEGLNGNKFPVYEFDELTEEEQNICKVQELSQKFKEVSKKPFPASLIIKPSSQCLDNYHKLAALCG